MTIDAHQHYWQTARGDLGWIPEGHAVLDRPWLPADLGPHLEAAGVTRTILVQAAPSVAETDWMLGVADSVHTVAAVVGWIDFADPDHRAHLECWARHPKFRGVRPMIQDIADDDWMLRDDLGWAFAALTEMGLTFDLLGLPRHLPNALRLLDRYPDLRCVLDHGMKPRIGAAEGWADWAEGMRRLAEDTPAAVKLSALLTEAPPGADAETLRPYADHLLGTFGAGRIMWGSDWPVCRLRCDYGEWAAMARTLCAALPGEDAAAVFEGTAAEFYGI